MTIITKKDRKEGEELINILESLPEEEKKQAVIYIRALSDRAMLATQKKNEMEIKKTG